MRFWHQGHWAGAGGADPALLWHCDRSPGWISGAAGVAAQSLPAPGTSSLRPLPPQQDDAVRPRAGRAPAAPGRSHRAGWLGTCGCHLGECLGLRGLHGTDRDRGHRRRGCPPPHPAGPESLRAGATVAPDNLISWGPGPGIACPRGGHCGPVQEEAPTMMGIICHVCHSRTRALFCGHRPCSGDKPPALASPSPRDLSGHPAPP